MGSNRDKVPNLGEFTSSMENQTINPYTHIERNTQAKQDKIVSVCDKRQKKTKQGYGSERVWEGELPGRGERNQPCRVPRLSILSSK